MSNVEIIPLANNRTGAPLNPQPRFLLEWGRHMSRTHPRILAGGTKLMEVVRPVEIRFAKVLETRQNAHPSTYSIARHLVLRITRCSGFDIAA